MTSSEVDPPTLDHSQLLIPFRERCDAIFQILDFRKQGEYLGLPNFSDHIAHNSGFFFMMSQVAARDRPPRLSRSFTNLLWNAVHVRRLR